jgi:hypothetical protein
MGKQFLVCTKCDHKYIYWIRKEKIEAANKVLKRTFDRKIAEFNEKKKLNTGKGLKKPTVEQMPLLIRCNCSKHYHSGYSSNCAVMAFASFAISRVPSLVVPPTMLQ